MVWTDEMRAKAATTRAATKAKKEARLAKKQQREENHRDNKTEPVVAAPIHAQPNVAGIDSEFDWETTPLNEIINRQSEMKKEYERISQIVLRRQNPPNVGWTCWSQENKSRVPASVLSQCMKHGADGKWKYRDDGRFIIENGVRRMSPAFCCNYLCYAVYQKYRVMPSAREVNKV